MKELKILSPTAILGYGFPEESFAKGMELKPDVIAVDAGSTDPGPYYLGAGYSFTDRFAVKRDLEIMLEAGLKNKAPVIIGSAGGSGAKPHLLETKAIIDEIAKENKLSFKMAVIEADISLGEIEKKLAGGRVKPLHPAPVLERAELLKSERVVAQMGVEPFIEALKTGADVILAGRSYDPAVFAALPIYKGYDKALSVHLGKILECAAIAATPGSGSDCMFGVLGKDYFKVFPLNSQRKCTTASVAAHTLYEKTNPYILPGPGGHLDLTESAFVQDNENTVIVRGSRFVPTEKYYIKLEGVKKTGYRTVSVAGIRDTVAISKIDEICEGVRKRVCDNFKSSGFDYFLNFIIYGKNGVMGRLEPLKETKSHELGIIIEAIGAAQEVAETICAFARSTMLHYGYSGRISTAGNLALPFSPSDFSAGAVYEFNVYHLMEADSPTANFPISIVEY
jgi:hypothetical protein